MASKKLKPKSIIIDDEMLPKKGNEISGNTFIGLKPFHSGIAGRPVERLIQSSPEITVTGWIVVKKTVVEMNMNKKYNPFLRSSLFMRYLFILFSFLQVNSFLKNIAWTVFNLDINSTNIFAEDTNSN